VDPDVAQTLAVITMPQASLCLVRVDFYNDVGKICDLKINCDFGSEPESLDTELGRWYL
jgi:hypothetical protein